MVIFHSYVNLPEGIQSTVASFQNVEPFWTPLIAIKPLWSLSLMLFVQIQRIILFLGARSHHCQYRKISEKCSKTNCCSWYPAHRRPWTEIHILAKRGWVGWGGILTFMYLAYIRGCYAAATSLGMGGVGGDINVHVPCLHTRMLRCCYVTGHGWGGGGY